jgi:hypothetical protein
MNESKEVQGSIKTNIKSINAQKLERHGLAKLNYNKYGTVRIGSSPSNEFIFIGIYYKGKYSASRMFSVELLPLSDFENHEQTGDGYKSTAFFGIYATVDKGSFELTKTDERMDAGDKKILQNYINDNRSSIEAIKNGN